MPVGTQTTCCPPTPGGENRAAEGGRLGECGENHLYIQLII